MSVVGLWPRLGLGTDGGHALVVDVKVAVPVDPVERDELLGLQAVDEISIKGQERRQKEGL